MNSTATPGVGSMEDSTLFIPLNEKPPVHRTRGFGPPGLVLVLLLATALSTIIVVPLALSLRMGRRAASIVAVPRGRDTFGRTASIVILLAQALRDRVVRRATTILAAFTKPLRDR